MLGWCLDYREKNGVLDKTPTNEELHLSLRDVTDSWRPCTRHPIELLFLDFLLPFCSLMGGIFSPSGTSFLPQQSFLPQESTSTDALSVSKPLLFIAYEVSLKRHVWCSTFRIWFGEFQSRSKDSNVLYVSFDSDANGLLKGLSPEQTVLKSSNNL